MDEYKLSMDDMQALRSLMGSVVSDISNVAHNSTENSSALRVNPQLTAAQFQNTLRGLVQAPTVSVVEAQTYPTPEGGSIPVPPIVNPATLPTRPQQPLTPQIKDNTNHIVKGMQTGVEFVDYGLATNNLTDTIRQLNTTLQNCSFYKTPVVKKKLKKKNGIRNQTRNAR